MGTLMLRLAGVRFAPILLQKSKIEQRQKFRESRFLADSIAAKFPSADTRAGGRFCLK
jgi:hypothetical protein